MKTRAWKLRKPVALVALLSLLLALFSVGYLPGTAAEEGEQVFIKAPNGLYWGVEYSEAEGRDVISTKTVFPTVADNAFTILREGDMVALRTPAGDKYVCPAYPCEVVTDVLPWGGFTLEEQGDGTTAIKNSGRDDGYYLRLEGESGSRAGEGAWVTVNPAADGVSALNKFRIIPVADHDPALGKTYVKTENGKYWKIENGAVAYSDTKPPLETGGFEIVEWDAFSDKAEGTSAAILAPTGGYVLATDPVKPDGASVMGVSGVDDTDWTWWDVQPQDDGTVRFFSHRDLASGGYYLWWHGDQNVIGLSGPEWLDANTPAGWRGFTLEPALELASRKVYIKSPGGHFWGVNADGAIVAETVFPTEEQNAFTIAEHISEVAPSGVAVSIEVPGGGRYVSPAYPCVAGEDALPWNGFEMRPQADGTYVFFSFREAEVETQQGYNISQFKNEVSLSAGISGLTDLNKFRVYDVEDFDPAQDKVFIKASDGRYFGVTDADPDPIVTADTVEPTLSANGFEIVRWPNASSSTGTPVAILTPTGGYIWVNFPCGANGAHEFGAAEYPGSWNAWDMREQDDGTVAFFSANRDAAGYFLSHEQGQSWLTGGADGVGAANKFTLEPVGSDPEPPVDDDRVYIQAASGKFWSVIGSGLVATTTEPTPERNGFRIVEGTNEMGDVVDIETPDGQHVVPTYPVSLSPNAFEFNGFRMEEQDDGTVTFYSFRDNGHHISMDGDTVSMNDQVTNITASKKFKIIPIDEYVPGGEETVPDTNAYIKAANGKYLRVDENNLLIADVETPTEDHLFQIVDSYRTDGSGRTIYGLRWLANGQYLMLENAPNHVVTHGTALEGWCETILIEQEDGRYLISMRSNFLGVPGSDNYVYGYYAAADETCVFEIEKQAPAITTDYDDKSDQWNSAAAIDITVTVEDATGAGIGEVSYKVNGGVKQPVTLDADGRFVLTVPEGDGTFRIAVTAVDNNGATSIKNLIVKRDTVRPTMSAVDTGSYIPGEWTKDRVTLSASLGTQGASGAQIYYAVGDGEFAEMNGTLSVQTDTNTTYRFKAVSGSGLESEEQTVEIKVDGNAPVSAIQVKDNFWRTLLHYITFGVFFNDTVDVSITAEDAFSGVQSVEYIRTDKELTDEELDAAEWTPYTAAWKEEPNTSFILYARVTDQVGNQAILSTEGIVLYTDSTVEQDTYYLDGKTAGDLPIKLSLNGNTLTEVRNGEEALVENQDYTFDGETVTVKQAYLAAQENEWLVLDFIMSAGEDLRVSIFFEKETPGGIQPTDPSNPTTPPTSGEGEPDGGSPGTGSSAPAAVLMLAGLSVVGLLAARRRRQSVQ